MNSKSLWALLAIALIALVAYGAWSVLNPPGGQAGSPGEVGLADAVALRDRGAFVLDVRQPDEWNEYHVPGSTLVPLGELSKRLSEIPQEREVLVVCRSGNRSQQGRDILLNAGYPRVTSLAGGLSQWKAAGYPTVTGP